MDFPKSDNLATATPVTIHQHGLLQTAAQARAFMLAGNSTVTLRSKRSGARFTYRVRKPEGDDKGFRFVSLLNGPDNESQYAYLGYLRREVYFHGGVKAKVGRDAPSAKAFEWAWQVIVRDRDLNAAELE